METSDPCSIFCFLADFHCGGQGSGLSWVVSNPSLGVQWGLAAEAVFTVAVVWILLAWKLTDDSVSALAAAADPLILHLALAENVHPGSCCWLTFPSWGLRCGLLALNSVTLQASSLDQMEAPSPNLFLGAAQEIRFCLSPCRIMPCYWVHLECSHSQVGASQPARWAPPRAPKRKTSDAPSLSPTYLTNLPTLGEIREREIRVISDNLVLMGWRVRR